MTDLTPHMKRMVKARTSLIMKQPFYGVLALYLQLVEDASIETMQTNGKYLKFSPARVDELTDAELEGESAHEVSHCAYKHHLRRGNRDLMKWNIACDYAINPGLLQAGFVLPKDVLNEARFRNMSAEEIYAQLDKEEDQARPQSDDKQQQQQGAGGSAQGPQNGPGKQPQQQQQQSPSDGQGTSTQDQAGQGQGQQQSSSQSSGQGMAGPQEGPASDGRSQGRSQRAAFGKVVDGVEDDNKAEIGKEEAEWDQRVAQALAFEARRHEAGKLPGHMQIIADATKAGKHDWRDTLRRFIDDRNRQDYSFTNPNKRLLGRGFVMPGMVPDGVNHVGVIVDTSASTRSGLSLFEAELRGAMQDGCVAKFTVIYVDTMVRKTEEYVNGDEFKLRAAGGGGTMFSPAFVWFAENAPDVSALIYFTDLECNDWGEEPACPVMWAAYGPANLVREREKSVPFGSVIHILD